MHTFGASAMPGLAKELARQVLMRTAGPAHASGAAWATACKLEESLAMRTIVCEAFGPLGGENERRELTLARDLAEQFSRLAHGKVPG